MNFAVLVFPGSNCDLDCYHAVEDAVAQPVDYVWHTETDLSRYDCIIIPGGFSYGDYLRSGGDRPVCAGDESGRRGGPGRQIYPRHLQRIPDPAGKRPAPRSDAPQPDVEIPLPSADLVVENNRNPFTADYEEGEIISIPIAHGEGNYYCDGQTLARLKANGQIVFRYAGENPNGSVDAIAGICNEQGNVLGMMPHPERAVNPLLGSVDGKKMFTSILRTWREKHGAATG